MTLSKGGKARSKALARAFAMSLTAVIPAVSGGAVFAQSQQPVPVIEAPSIFEFETSTTSPMSILIKPEKSAPQRGMLLIRGLPNSVALTEGRLFPSGVWSVKLTDLPNLKLSAPASMQTSNITIALVTLEGSILDEKSAILSIAAASTKNTYSMERGAEPAPKVEPASPPAQSVAALPGDKASGSGNTRPAAREPKSLTFEETEKVQVFMQKGEEHMRSGNINLARLFYKRSADAGWAPGAMAMAGTYDAEELAHLDVVGGIQPDPAMAKKWYEVARDLGSATAQQKLQRLGQR